MDSDFLWGSNLHLGRVHGEFSNGYFFPWIFSGIFVLMIAFWIAYTVVWKRSDGMCSHSTVSKGMDLHEMEIARGIRDADAMTVSSDVEAVEMRIIDTLTDVCVHLRTSAEWTVVSTLFRLRCVYHGTLFGNNLLVEQCNKATENEDDSFITPDVLGDCYGKGTGLREELENLTRFLTRRCLLGPDTEPCRRV